ncbi:MAG: protein kinase [Lachnospiraceae bacterium]|nr:protein kinase [Lachnospiraceae bacterium]
MITLNNKHLCENCFSETTTEPCPRCGFTKIGYRPDPLSLAVGSILNQRYLIGGVIGKGGFGITYLAYDLKLDARIAVKEYYPMGLAMRNPGSTLVTVTDQDAGESFRTGAAKFYNEAKMVAKFNGNPNIVSVHDFFYENETVYFVMGYLEGQTLKSYIKNKHITEGQAVNILQQISNALLASHSMNILHRDISPDNIMLCDDRTIRLLDFGAARQVMAEQSQSLSVILKQGFAPLEQYQKKGKQGPWTDFYALGATIYNALTGDMLNDPMSRLEDDSEYESNKFGISEALWKVIQKCTALKPADRYQNVSELKAALAETGIDPEPFTDIDPDIKDRLKNNAENSSTGLSQGKTNNPVYAPAADPNATVLLSGSSEDARSDKTMALSPEEAASYSVPRPSGAPVQPQPQANQGVPGQPVPQGNQGIPGQPLPQANQGIPGQPLHHIKPGQPYPSVYSGTSKRKGGIHPVLLVILIILAVIFIGLIGLTLFGLAISSSESQFPASEEMAETEKDIDEQDESSEETAGSPETYYPGAYYALGFYNDGKYTQYDEISSWYVDLYEDGSGYLYLGEENQGKISKWSMDGDMLTLKAGASVFEGYSTIFDGVLYLDFDDFIIAFTAEDRDNSDLDIVSE